MRDILEKKYSQLDIDTINTGASVNPAGLVASSEEYYNSQVFKAARQIAQTGCKFVLLCGPSASGKTTTAHKLKHRLVAQGIGAQVISMDNFFKGMDFYPKLADGSPDMESFLAVDHELLNACFEKLLNAGTARFPMFDFTVQQRVEDKYEIKLGANDVLIMEGIHALNPQVLSNISRKNIFRIYVSVRTKFVSGEDTVLVPKDIRLMRRMVRDHYFRNYPPASTLKAWANVVAAERVNIDLYRDDVELKIDNTIDYEVCIWRAVLQNLLQNEIERYDQNQMLWHIVESLGHFVQIDPQLIPHNSLLREFIGKNA